MSQKDSYGGQLLDQAQEAFDREDYSTTVHLLNGWNEPDQFHGDICQLRGLAHYLLGDNERALPSLETATMLIPLSPIAQCAMADCYIRTRKRDIAIVIYEHLSTIEQLPERVAELVAKGLSKVGHQTAALNFCLLQLRVYRANPVLMYHTSEAMRQLNYPVDELLPFAYQAHKLKPGDNANRVSYAQHLCAAGRYEEVARLLAPLDVDEIDCIASLERMKTMFEQIGDVHRRDQCAAKLKGIEYQVGSTYRAPKNDDNNE